jgi:hypothetical protein
MARFHTFFVNVARSTWMVISVIAGCFSLQIRMYRDGIPWKDTGSHVMDDKYREDFEKITNKMIRLIA